MTADDFESRSDPDFAALRLRAQQADLAELGLSRAEEALRVSEERYRALYEENPSMYFSVDREGRVLSVNPFGAEQLGFSVEELVDSSVLDVFHPDDRDEVRRHLVLCLEHAGQTMTWEFRKVRKDGSVMWVRELARAVEQTDGSPLVLVVCEDISDRKAIELALEEAKAQLREIEAAAGKAASLAQEMPGFGVDLPTEMDTSRTPGEAPLPSKTVLLVEDEDAVRSLAGAILERSDFRVLVAADADEALRVFSDPAVKIDLLVTDIMMPGVTGLQLVEEIRRTAPKLPVLFMSGHSDEAVERGGDLGSDTLFLAKPFSATGLVASVRRALDDS